MDQASGAPGGRLDWLVDIANGPKIVCRTPMGWRACESAQHQLAQLVSSLPQTPRTAKNGAQGEPGLVHNPFLSIFLIFFGFKFQHRFWHAFFPLFF